MTEAIRLAGWGGIILFLFGLLSFAVSGTFDPWTVIHLAGGAVLMATAAAVNLAGLRRTVTARGTRERAQAATGTALFAAILVTANVAAVRHPWSRDVTENRIHTLSDKTQSILSHLDTPVELTAFFKSGDDSKAKVETLLQRFAAVSPKFTFRFVDPEQHPEIAKQLDVRQMGTLVASTPSSKASIPSDGPGGVGEGALASLVLKVARPASKIIYALTGHGEPAVDDLEGPAGLGGFAHALSGENLTAKPLLLSTQAAVPDDAGLLIVAGPRKPLLAHEAEAIRSYVTRGGRLMLLLDPGNEPGLEALLADVKIRLGDDMIVDQTEIPFLGARLGLDPIIEDFPEHPITHRFKERIVLSQARSLGIREEGGLPGVEDRVVARTRDTAWAESDWRAVLQTGRVAKDDADKAGPIVVAVAATIPASGASGATAARVLAVGDSDWIANESLSAYFNQEFALNAVHWLMGTEDLIAEPPRNMRASRLDMTESQFLNLSRLSMLLLPEALLIVGIAIWRARRAS